MLEAEFYSRQKRLFTRLFRSPGRAENNSLPPSIAARCPMIISPSVEALDSSMSSTIAKRREHTDQAYTTQPKIKSVSLFSPPIRVHGEVEEDHRAAYLGPPVNHLIFIPTMSEIDAIFQSTKTGSNGASVLASSVSSFPATSLSNSKRKSKKKSQPSSSAGESSSAALTTVSPEPDIPTGKKRTRVPETILDPSLPKLSSAISSEKIPPSSKKRRRTDGEGGDSDDHAGDTATRRSGRPYTAKRQGLEGLEDLDRFRDSRGTGPRRTTEEGFAIYKEDELGIKDEGGDTPLCPFDCDCCF